MKFLIKMLSGGDRLRHVPLAESVRPSSLDDYFGQEEVAGKQGFWRSLIQVELLVFEQYLRICKTDSKISPKALNIPKVPK